VIPDDALDAASAAVPAGTSVDKDDLIAILEAAAPHLAIAAHWSAEDPAANYAVVKEHK
jgi:hypothetical protein